MNSIQVTPKRKRMYAEWASQEWKMSPQGSHHKETGGYSMEPPPAPVLELLAAAVSSQHCQQCFLGQYPVGFTGLGSMGNPIAKKSL